jgi:ribosomal protein S18 acetylase RimI-like enzyme
MPVSVRDARAEDFKVIVRFNLLLAFETEGKSLDLETLRPGVKAVLADPAKGRYFVAELDGEVVGQTMITLEWSDWRNGWFWWIQSVYVRADARRRGVFRALYAHARQTAQSEGGVVGLRLYVERENHVAQETYRGLGMEEMPFLLMHRQPL